MFNSNYGSILHRFWDVWFWKILQSEALKVIKTGTIQQPAYGFLLASYNNTVSKMHRLWDIRLWKVPWPWNHGYRITQGNWK